MSVFLSTLSLRRATGSTARARKEPLFLSTLSLRRATCDTLSALAPKQFLSTLSLRRATTDDRKRNEKVKFLSTLSLRRATHRTDAKSPQQGISIHALLAESDLVRKIARSAFMIFLSTLSLRRATIVHFSTFRQSTAFLSTLSLRRATGCSCAVRCRIGISIHALLAESDTPRMFCRCRVRHFYPRSPCGERPWHMETIKLPAKISIHALLAESDNSSYGALDGASISIHALLAESDWQAGAMQLPTAPFLSTLSLRRATAAALLLGKNYVKFLSTLSLRRATHHE